MLGLKDWDPSNTSSALCVNCDAVDAWCARRFIQGLAQLVYWLYYPKYIGFFHRPGLIFVSLLELDIGSHGLQMYSTFLTGKTSHKDVKDSTNWLFKAYYWNRMFMGYCCLACEVLYLILFLVADSQNKSLGDMKTAADACVLYDMERQQKQKQKC